jgi:hypothetical protein
MATAKGVVYACYAEDGKRKRRKIGLLGSRVAALRKARDEFFAGLVAQGATVATRGPYKTTPQIRTQPPFVVKYRGKIIARCQTLAEAQKKKIEEIG